MPTIDPLDLPLLQALSASYPTIDSAVAEIAALRATLTLPAPTIHVISDIHGQYDKLRHVINNASGALRPMVESLFTHLARFDPRRRDELLAVLYYPSEAMALISPRLTTRHARRDWVFSTLRLQFELVMRLAARSRRGPVRKLFPHDMAELFEELLENPTGGRDRRYVDAMIDVLIDHGRDFDAVRAASRLVRNLTADEIIVAGDLGDRGPRIDKVIDYLMRQPRVTLLWGNHDASWMGACLGQPACIATVIRFSLRYGRVAQLEEGYGIPLSPLADLARAVYHDDPAEHFEVKGAAPHESRLLAQMQKAISIMLFKLEGSLLERRPEWNLGDRRLLHLIKTDATGGATIALGGHTHALLDSRLPTLDPADPYRLSADEQRCLDALRMSFLASQTLWEQMSWVAKHGGMWTRRDALLIFHACVPVDDAGSPLELEVNGRLLAGRELMDALAVIVRRAFRAGGEHLRPDEASDADWLYYLWAGPRSPLFGKDKLATFESHFIADKHVKEETKNPYFTLLHEADFARRIGRLFGMGDDVLIVNGHVPVKVEKGETPVKRGGNAVTIDGAFSEAYGDRGYTLIMGPAGISLAEHSHFDSVQDVIHHSADMIPRITPIRADPAPLMLADTQAAEQISARVAALEKLIEAYTTGAILEAAAG